MHPYNKIRPWRIRWFRDIVFNILLSLLLLSVGTNALAATETFNPTGDTYVAAEIPDMKFCNEPTVAIATHTDILAYVKFNISSIPSGSIIDSAELRLTCMQIIDNGPVAIGRVSSSWNECDVDWNHQPAVEPPVVTSTPPGTYQWWKINVTSIVEEGFEDNASNMGFRLEKLSDGLVQFYSSESSTKPQLVVSYTPGYYNASGEVISISTAQGIQSVELVFSRVIGSGDLPEPAYSSALGQWSQGGFEPGTTYRVTPTNQPSQPPYTYVPQYRSFSSSAGSNVTGLDFSADTSYSVTIQSQPTGADVRLGSVDASPTCTTECTLTGLEGNQIVWLTKDGYEDLEFVLTPNDDGTTKNFPLTAAITLNFTAPFSGASPDHIEYEGPNWGIRVLGAAPSDTDPESGEIHHASILNTYLAGASTWQVDDTVKWHFSVPRSGRYKVTVNGDILGNIGSAGTGVVYDCKHLLVVGASIVGEGSIYSRLHDTLAEDVTSGIVEISAFGAELLCYYIPGCGWFNYVLDAYDVYSLAKTMDGLFEPVASFNGDPILGDDWYFYADLETNEDYQFEFFVRSAAVGGVSAASMYSFTDVMVSFTDVTFEQISGSVTEPMIQVTPVGMLEMETTYVGQSTENSSAFTVKNVGNQLLTGSATIETGPFEIISAANYSLNPGEESDISIRFLSDEPGIYTKKITFSGGKGAECYVRCEAREADPVLGIYPDHVVDFGKVACGTSKDMNTFIVANTGGGTLTGNVTVNSPFSIVSSESYSLAEGQTLNVMIRFAPTSEGILNGNVMFTGGGGATRQVSGEGIDIAVAPLIDSILNDSTMEGSEYLGPIPALIQGIQPITWSLVTNPVGMTINPESGFVKWPNPTAIGSPHEITIRATNTAGYDDESWQLTVVPPGVCTYIISPTSRSFGSSGGSDSISVSAPSGCDWNATSNDGWIMITSGSSGSGNGTVNYSVSSNSSASSRTGTMTIAGEIFTVTQSGNDMAVVFIADFGSNEVMKLYDDGAEYFRVGGFNFLNQGAVSANLSKGTVMVADSNNDRIVEVSENGEVISSAYGFSYPPDVSVNLSDGTCWVADRGHDQVVKLSSDLTTELVRLGGFNNPLSVSVNSTDGSCWVGDGIYNSTNQVVKLSPNGEILFSIVGGFNIPLVCVNSSDGTCWVADQYNGRVVKLSPDGEELFANSNFSLPFSVSVNVSDGACWVADRGSDEIVKLSANGEELLRVGGFDFLYYEGAISVNSNNGTCWVADSGNSEVVKLSSEGAELLRVTGFDRPHSISVCPHIKDSRAMPWLQLLLLDD